VPSGFEFSRRAAIATREVTGPEEKMGNSLEY
jgi:hypothetical protein